MLKKPKEVKEKEKGKDKEEEIKKGIEEGIIEKVEVEVEVGVEIMIIIIEGEVVQKKQMYALIVEKKDIGQMNVIYQEKKGK